VKKRGITLVDFLVMATIVEILAAIAVPNFLEAKVRSNLSRCRADMRSMAASIEAYHVDHDYYPTYHYTQYSYEKDPFNLGGSVTEWFIGGNCVDIYSQTSPFPGPNQITTPVAYLSALPEDPFHEPEEDDPFETMHLMYVNWEHYNDEINVFHPVLEMWGSWRLTSGGPDLSRHDSLWITYDPTNGLTSLGQVHHSHLTPEGIPTDPW